MVDATQTVNQAIPVLKSIFNTIGNFLHTIFESLRIWIYQMSPAWGDAIILGLALGLGFLLGRWSKDKMSSLWIIFAIAIFLLLRYL